MGKPGFPPAPTKIKMLRGNPGRRPLNKTEPQPIEKIPACPDWLDKEGRTLWAKTAPMLERLRVMTEADVEGLEMLCDAYSQWKAARKVLMREGNSIEVRDKNKCLTMYRARTEVAIVSDSFKRVKTLLAEFGMTPSSRSHIHVLPEKKVDPFEEFLKSG